MRGRFGVQFVYAHLVECSHQYPFSYRTFQQPNVAAEIIQEVWCASPVGNSLIGEILDLWTQYDGSLDNIPLRHLRGP